MLAEYQKKILQARASKTILEKQILDTAKALEYEKAKTLVIEQVQVLIQTVAKETQEQLCYHVCDIVNTAIDTIFNSDYTFKMDFEIKRGKTEANLYLLKEGEKIDPVDAVGGGLVDVISFALRLSALTLGTTDKVIVLDEPAKFLSQDLKPLFGEVLKNLSQKLGLQIVFVTHDEAFIDIADRVFEVSIKHGKSLVEVRG